MKRSPDFSGWATRYGTRCDDGRVIVRDAFKDNDGKKVSLIYNHDHGNLFNVLGHAILHNTPEGVRADCYLNNTKQGQMAKEVIKSGDVNGFSIYANMVRETPSSEVMHGNIRELSLVLSGANPGAYIDNVMSHDGYTLDDEYIITTIWDKDQGLVVNHSGTDDEEEKEKKEVPEATKETDTDTDKPKSENTANSDVTIGEKLEKFSKEDQEFIAGLVGLAIEDAKKGNNNPEEGEKKEMKHNVFDTDANREVISHAAFENVMTNAKKCGSFREAMRNAIENGELMHTSAPIPTEGMDLPTGHSEYGFNDPDMLFPEFKSLNNPPEWISREMGWVSIVMNGVHRTPFSRIKSQYANITEDEARAKGYIKGNKKKEEVFSILKRTTTPQTVYKLQKMDRDDIIDITDFDVVAWIRAEMRVMLNEEIARAILIGDGRLSSDDDKISEDHIRPIAKDVPLFNTTVKVTYEEVPNDDDATSEVRAKKLIRSVIRARKNYKGSGNPAFFTTEDYLTDMLLLEDGIGHKMYKTEAELATALRVSRIITVEAMEGQTITSGNDELNLIGVIVNLKDYNVGADKGGEINNFEDFDIDYNQYKYLIETRCSGALVKPFAAITLLDDPQSN